MAVLFPDDVDSGNIAGRVSAAILFMAVILALVIIIMYRNKKHKGNASCFTNKHINHISIYET